MSPAADPLDLTLPAVDAIAELRLREQIPGLKKQIEDYFGGDIPTYLNNGPVLYMARHIGTPNFESLRFLSLIKELELPVVISQDSRGLFVTQNHIKKALCKLPICTRVSQKGGKLNEHYHKISVVDCNTENGKPFSEVVTLWGEKLADFHSRLFKELGHEGLEFPDDAEWVDRHGRGNLLAHYKELFMLFVVHGVFFENYNLNDPHEVAFVRDILRPACAYVKEQTGYSPLISPIFPLHHESYDFWISYPSKVRDVIRKSMHKSGLLKPSRMVSV